MKHLIPLVRRSAQKTFRLMRKNSPYYCTELNTDVQVTKLFFDHIAYHKWRGVSEQIKRLLIIPFLDEILIDGKVINQRNRGEEISFRISKKFDKEFYTVIVIQKRNKFLLLSCFID